MFERLRQLFRPVKPETKQLGPNVPITKPSQVILYEGQWLQYPSWDMRAQIAEGFEANSVVYACVDLIAHSASSVDWYLVQSSGGKSREIEDWSHPLASLLRRPNPKKAYSSFIDGVIRYLLITGNSFIWANRLAPKQPPLQMWGLRPDRWAIQPRKNPITGDPMMGVVDYYEYTVQGNAQKFLPEDVLHLTLFESEANEWFGLSPVKVGALLVDSDNKAVNWNRNLLGNRARPDSAFVFKNGLTDPQRAMFKQELDEKMAGSNNAGRPLILEGDSVEFKQLASTPVEMDFVQSTSMTNRRICQLFGVAPELIGDPQNKTYANQKEARYALFDQTVCPILEFVRTELNHWLAPAFGEGIEIEYDKDSIDVYVEKRSEKLQSLTTVDFLSINEKREAVGYDTIDDPEADLPDALRTMPTFGSDPTSDPGDGEGEPPPDDAEPEGKKRVGALENKFLNIDTEEKRVSFWSDVDRKRRAFEKPATKRMQAHFARERKAIVSGYRSSKEEGALSAAGSMVPSLRGVLKGIYSQAGGYFFKQAAYSINQGEVKDIASAWRKMTARFEAAAIDRAQKIVETTKKRIADLLHSELLAGKTDEEIADRLDAMLEISGKTRAVTVAENETGMAVNAGITAGADSTEKTLTKSWISQRDERVRDHHQEADGQTISLNGLFIVKGEQLEYPGDDSHGASADNVINCRCYLAFNEV